MARIIAKAALPTAHGPLDIYAFEGLCDGAEHVAIAKGDLAGAVDLPTRLHSQCITGDVFASRRCDCREQLEKSLAYVAGRDRGMVLYMAQEGRGIGLANKVRAYALQDQGLDTVDANLALGFADDERDYAAAAEMIACLDVGSIRLMTNNPNKVAQLRRAGIDVSGRLAHEIEPNVHNRHYLATKKARSGHLLTRVANRDQCRSQSVALHAVTAALVAPV